MHARPNEQTILEHMERTIQSQQPRFSQKSSNPDAFFSSTIRWVTAASQEEPPYKVDSRTRDRWLSSFWKQEPHLAGVMSSVNAIDANRGWTLTGGRNQVLRFLPIFRNADNDSGWRQYISQQSQAYYGCDIGSLTEVARDGQGGPLGAIYHLDPTKCYLTGKPDGPLRYDRTKEAWSSEDYFRLVSMKNLDERFYGLGFCAVSRCLEMARIMLSLYGYQQEQLGTKAPHGLLLLQNISQNQWAEAMKTRDAALDSEMRKYYEMVAVIAQQGVDSVDAKLVALSNLPEGFNLETFTDLLMHAYSLCFNYDSSEFWPGGGGAIGRGRETDIQHRKGAGKGGLNFMLAYQDQMARELPASLLFEFEQRDQEGELLTAAVAQAWSNVVATLFAGGSSSDPGPAGTKGGSGEAAMAQPQSPSPTSKDNQTPGNPKDQLPASNTVKTPKVGMISLAEARQLLAMNGIIPMNWTQQEEDVSATDEAGLDIEKQRLLETPSIRRALELYPFEPIVRYRWPLGRMETVFGGRQDAYSARRYTMVKPQFIEQSVTEEMVDVIDGDEVLRLPAPVPFETQPRRIDGGFNLYQGDSEPLRVTVRNNDRQEVDVSASSQIWYVIYVEDIDRPVLIKELGRGITVDRSVISVEFEAQDTESLYGNYYHSLKVADDLGRVYTVYHGQMAVFKERVDG